MIDLMFVFIKYPDTLRVISYII